MAAHQVRCLLMGGQACVFYGAAEFSRDSDFAILAEPANLERLRGVLRALDAEVIAVPPFEIGYLLRGHAIHFRARHSDCAGLRIDVMAVMRGVESFPQLWERRTTLELADAGICHLLSIPDLVRAKKTQRDKDWPMIRRLLEADYFQHRDRTPDPDRVAFWLREMRTPELLIAVTTTYPELSVIAQSERPLLAHSLAADFDALESALQIEELNERRRDREHWLPLKKELESLQHAR